MFSKTTYEVVVHSYDRRWRLNDQHTLTMTSKHRDSNKVRVAVLTKAHHWMMDNHHDYRTSEAQTLAIEKA